MFVKVILGGNETGRTEKLYDVRLFQFDDMMDDFNDVADTIQAWRDMNSLHMIDDVEEPKHLNPAGYLLFEYLDGKHDCIPLDSMIVQVGICLYIMNSDGKTVDRYKWSLDNETGQVSLFRNRK